MNRTITTHAGSAGYADAQAQPRGGIRFDWTAIGFSAWLLGGLFVDGWAHNHGKVDQSFFTPWHALFYSGFFAAAGFLVLTLIRNLARGYAWQRALPDGYEFSLLGAAVFAFGGVGDLVWHTLFGIEENVEALLSPTHLLLVLGIGLIISGPLRAAWRRPDANTRGWGQRLPMLLSLTFLLSLGTFITLIAHPLANLWGAGSHPSDANLLAEQGVVSILLESALVMGVVLFAIRRWSLAPGSLTLIFGLNAGAMGLLYDQGGYPLAQVAAAAAAGVVADLLLQRLKPSVGRTGALRLFAFAVPVVVYALYFLALRLTAGVWWSIHLWMGTTVLAGGVGWLLSYLLVPPPLPAQQSDASTS